MEKGTLKKIFETPYDEASWRDVLREVLNVRELRERPVKVSITASDLADGAWELGSLTTSDSRIVGLYRVNLTDKPRIWQNRVGLRRLLKSIYADVVDAAIVVFVQGEQWRLSFISEIRVLTDEGTVETKATEPKRFTYLLGGNKTKTATDRIYSLNAKKLFLDDIRVAFSVEALNNEFYKHVAGYFYDLVGSTTKKGKETQHRDRLLRLPGVGKDDHRTHQEFAVRLIGRTVFCWFLREKKSDYGRSLLPETLLSSEAVRKNKGYYHSILERLFFQTLNTPMDDRISDLPAGCETVPFLNGGLFEPQSDDYYDFNPRSQTSNHINTLKIPDDWFAEFFGKLEEYNFTIDENSPTEVEISVDPEMLGRIFENLLAEIDPDSGETARKATGSFYTPREIVNYMVDESLLLYLQGKLAPDEKASETVEANLRNLFSYAEEDNPFDKVATRKLIKAIDECKILDPACGSGAFPIGALQRLVFLIGKLDKKNDQWIAMQVEKMDELINAAKSIDDPKTRKNVIGDLEKRRDEIVRDFTNKEVDFGRKLFLIENCIYGVDIQPIAAEISKLRCFLTLIVDDTIAETKPNRGVNPLPNLEFKFVTADALLKLPKPKQIGLFNSDTQLAELEAIRHEYMNSFGEAKELAKAHFKSVQDEIFDSQIRNFGENQDRRAVALSIWDPFGHGQVAWFDSEWMFGVRAFDIVIGNPPYGVDFSDTLKQYIRENYNSYKYKFESYIYFIERAFDLAKKMGVVCFILPELWLKLENAHPLRKIIAERVAFPKLRICGENVLDKTVVNTVVPIFVVEGKSPVLEVHKGDESWKIETSEWNNAPNLVIDYNLKPQMRAILHRIRSLSQPLSNFGELVQGITPYDKYKGHSADLIKSRGYHYTYKHDETCGKWLAGGDVERYGLKWSGEWISYGDWLGAPRDRRFFEGKRLLFREIPGKNKRIQATLAIQTFFHGHSITPFKVFPGSDLRINYLLAILNSQLISWYGGLVLPNFGKEIFPKLNPQDIKALPVPVVNDAQQNVFEILVDYILFLKDREGVTPVNDYVPNKHLSLQFEEIVDGLVCEIYFQAEFRQASIELLTYAARDFQPIQGLNQNEAIKTIESAYQTLRRKDSEIRNNLKLIDIRLANLLGPIQSQQ